MKNAYADDLSDFIRNGRLDSYELTDEELAHFLEVWRWAVWTQRGKPTGADYHIADAVERLQAHMLQQHGVEVEYNTLLLMRQELEPMMHLRVIWDAPRALFYFLRPRNLLYLIRAYIRARRYDRLEPTRDWRTARRGYGKHDIETANETAPDLLRRKYWHRVGPSLRETRKRPDYWG